MACDLVISGSALNGWYKTKGNDINLNDRNQMQNDTENEIGRSLFPFIHGLRIVIGFYLQHVIY